MHAHPPIVDRATWKAAVAELDQQLSREKADTREGDAIAAARRRLPMTEVPSTATVVGPNGPVSLGQCEGCTHARRPRRSGAFLCGAGVVGAQTRP
ncbi:DUF899 family protein [Ornithinimicrobium faecis]